MSSWVDVSVGMLLPRIVSYDPERDLCQGWPRLLEYTSSHNDKLNKHSFLTLYLFASVDFSK